MTLVTDRTAADVEAARTLRQKVLDGTATADEKTAFLSTDLKGEYNYLDMRRVAYAVKEISDKMGLSLTPKTDWAENQTPTPSQLQKYLDDIKAVHDSVIGAPDIPGTISFDYAGANAIEEMLLFVNAYAERINAPRSNLAFSGGEL